MQRIMIVLAALALTACAASRDAHYAAQREYTQAIAAQNASKLAAVNASADACADDVCRVAVAGFAALVQSDRIERPAQYRSQATSILGLVERAVSVGAAVYGQKIQGESLVDLAGVIAGSAGDRSTHSYIDQSNHSDNSTSIADSYNDSSDNSTTGDTISDSYNIPTTIDVSGDGSAVGDGNDITNGHANDNSGDLRIDSPGPIDNSDPGDDCDGESCNPVTPEVPE